MKLSTLQKEFTVTIAELVLWAYENGYELTYGDAYRDPRVFGEVGEKVSYSHPKSAHKKRLAVDFNLFTEEGDYLTKTEDYAPLGRYWEKLHTSARWGGRFGDGNHFSFEHQGIK